MLSSGGLPPPLRKGQLTPVSRPERYGRVGHRHGKRAPGGLCAVDVGFQLGFVLLQSTQSALDHVTDADDARQLALGEDWYVSESAQGHRLADFFDGVLGGTGVDVGGHDVRDGYGKQSRTMASEPTDHVTFGNDADERALAGHDGG